MAKNSNYHRADVALLRAENEALKEKNALLEKQLAQQTELLQQMSGKRSITTRLASFGEI